jgi:hypothetical protein
VTRVESFGVWLTSFGDAWEAADADAAAGLFSVGATFQPTPFSALVRGRRAIRAHLAYAFGSWWEPKFAAQVLGAGDTYGVAHWRVASADRALDGIFVAAFDEHGRCTSLRQWWHESAGAVG